MSNVNEILVLGDSLSRGVIYSPAKGRYIFTKHSFANIIQAQIAAKIHNTSKFGCTIKHGEQILQRDFKKINPDVVFIEFGGNDCDYKWDEIAENPSAQHYPNTPFEEFCSSLANLVRFVQASGKTPVLMNLPPLHGENYLNWVSGGDAHKRQIIHDWLGGSDAIYWWHERYSCAVEDIAKKLGVYLIDVRATFLMHDPGREFICIDGIHPNAQGHVLIAKTISEFITSTFMPKSAVG